MPDGEILNPTQARRAEVLARAHLMHTPAEERFDRITRMACALFKVPVAGIALSGGRRHWFKSLQGLCSADLPDVRPLCLDAVEADALLLIEDVRADARYADHPAAQAPLHLRFYAGQPVHLDGVAVGTLCVMDSRPRGLDQNERMQLASLAIMVENELKLAALGAEQNRLLLELDDARRQALLDPLTGCWNRRGLAHLLPLELSRAQRHWQPVALALLDIDGLEAVNAQHGRATGDAALREITQRIRTAVRDYDPLLRLGGDEFVLFFAGVSQEAAVEICQRVLAAVHCTAVQVGGRTLSLTLSMGVAHCLQASERVLDRLMFDADQAMNAARAEGSARLHVVTTAPDSRLATNDLMRALAGL